MIYAVLISLIFVIIGIIKNKMYEYQKVISFAIIVYSILLRFMLFDAENRKFEDGTVLFSGGFILSYEQMGLLANITYFGMLIGVIALIHSYARK